MMKDEKKRKKERKEKERKKKCFNTIFLRHIYISQFR